MSSNVDKDKQKEEAEKQKRKEKKERQKHTEEENLKKIELQQSEKIRLNFVFNQLCELENEKSSDDDSKSKKYLRAINEKAKKKQMKIPKSKFKGKLETQNKKNYKIKDDEDMEEKEKKPSKKKFSRKALRKIIRKLCNEFAKDELDNMIWEVDENLDGYVSEEEFENMYKKCITDENEEEGKKLFYLTQFLMYDKDQKHEITVEDAKKIDPSYEAGDMLRIDVTPKNFGRVAAQTAKQVMIQKLREAERGSIYDEFSGREGDVITGTVKWSESRTVFVDLGRVEGILPYAEQIEGESFQPNDKIKCYNFPN